jgi:hypothetical protein
MPKRRDSEAKALGKTNSTLDDEIIQSRAQMPSHDSAGHFYLEAM